jgi:hypothetical protein
MTVNDRLRATTEAVAASMREVRPLTLPPDPSLLPPDPSLLPPDPAFLPPEPAPLPPDPAPRPPYPRRHRHRRPSPALPGRRFGRWRGWGSWLIPLAAAVAVIAVAATLVSVRDASGPRPASPAPSGPRPTAPAPAPLPAGSVPRYYVAVQPGVDAGGGEANVGEVNTVVVGDDRTGKPLATLKPPRGDTFDGVTGAADDRTFVLDVRSVPSPMGAQDVSYAWYLLRITPGAADPVRLTRLPITGRLEDAVIHGLALSPDGSTLAVMFMPNMAGAGTPGPITLRTWAVPTGKPLRVWTGSRPDGLVCFTCNNTVDLTWLDNGRTLAFRYPEEVLPQAIRTLDLSRPGSDLDTDSQAGFPISAADDSDCVDGLLSPDGRTVLCGTTGGPNARYGCAAYGAQFNAYSSATRKLERVLYRYRGSCAYASSSFVWAGSETVAIGLLQLYTSDAPGSETITNGTSSTTRSVPQWNDELIFGVVSAGKFTRLQVTMRNESQGVTASTPGLIAF